MNRPRAALRLALGRRLPETAGTVAVRGVSAPVTVRRDRGGFRWSRPRPAPTPGSGWGVCHGQDRAAQLDVFRRPAAGTLGELVGADGLAVDRLARRIGFRRAAGAQLAVLAPGVRAVLDAYAAGVTAGAAAGLPRNPCSPHYADLFPLWEAGDGVPIPWAPGEIAAAAVEALTLEPAGPAAGRP